MSIEALMEEIKHLVPKSTVFKHQQMSKFIKRVAFWASSGSNAAKNQSLISKETSTS